MNKWAEMQALVTVVKNGSITAAAEQLGVAKSAVSKRISELEKRLGVQLLVRTTRRLNLTEAGGRYFEQAEGLLATVEQVETDAASDQGKLSGRIRVAAPTVFWVDALRAGCACI